jgi:hypothetical protein
MELEVSESKVISVNKSMPLSFPMIKSETGNILDILMNKGINTSTNQTENVGDVDQPIDMVKAAAFRISNEHHASCIQTKTSATVGLGFADSREEYVDELTGQIKAREKDSVVDLILDPLCDVSFATTLWDIGEDFWEVANGYMEVVRLGYEPKGIITGLFHIPASTCRVHIDDEDGNFHYVVSSGNGNDKHFARYGDLERFKVKKLGGDQDKVSEVVHFRKPSSLNKYYGFPDWLSALASIELSQCLKQYKYDFYNNRGVPELLVTVTGGVLDNDTWKKLETALQANIGRGNTQKSVALNIPNPDITMKVDKLAMEGKGDGDTFENNTNTLALNIVTAHQVPPLLAGIQIPGKLGANNELPNALTSFQLLKIRPAQRLICQILKNTICQDPSIGISGDVIVFRTIMDEINMNILNTVGGMRQSLPEANAEGRDLNTGAKD